LSGFCFGRSFFRKQESVPNPAASERTGVNLSIADQPALNGQEGGCLIPLGSLIFPKAIPTQISGGEGGTRAKKGTHLLAKIEHGWVLNGSF
jgi:hypothetical protein